MGPPDRLAAREGLIAAGIEGLRGLTPTEFILNAWTKEPDRFRIDPSHLILGPYT